MGKFLIVIGVLFLITTTAVGWSTSYNTLIVKQEHVVGAWAQVESNMQRKHDLLPNLVETVNASASHGKNVFEAIAGQRAQSVASLSKEIAASSKQLETLHDSKSLPSGEQLQMISQLTETLDHSVFQLMAVAEDYPDLKSSENFLQLQSQIEGADNRINITRMQFNNSVREFNAYMKKIPGNITARLGGFQAKTYFKADKAAFKKFKVEI